MILCFGICPIEWIIGGVIALGIGGKKFTNFLRKKRCGVKECCTNEDGEYKKES